MSKPPLIRKLPAQEARVETGAVQFGDDWPGIFIRGDDALYQAALLGDLAALLTRCHVGTGRVWGLSRESSSGELPK